jgi:6-phosphofructokinase 2
VQERRAFQVKIASTVGAGDSFLAAMVGRLASGRDLETVFRYRVAAGPTALQAPGTSPIAVAAPLLLA